MCFLTRSSIPHGSRSRSACRNSCLWGFYFQLQLEYHLAGGVNDLQGTFETDIPPNGKLGKSSTQKCQMVRDMLVPRMVHPENHLIEQEHHLPSASIFGFQPLILQRCAVFGEVLQKRNIYKHIAFVEWFFERIQRSSTVTYHVDVPKVFIGLTGRCDLPTYPSLNINLVPEVMVLVPEVMVQNYKKPGSIPFRHLKHHVKTVGSRKNHPLVDGIL